MKVPPADEPRHDESDIASVVTAMYASISGPAGPRDCQWQEQLFHPDARMVRIEVGADERASVRLMNRDQYRENTAPYFAENDFYEVEISRRIDVFGDIAQVWSAYEARRDPLDSELERRGINSIELIRDATGAWRIISMIWDNERAGQTLPASLTGVDLPTSLATRR